MIKTFILSNIQLIFLVLLGTIVVLMILWSWMPFLLYAIYRKLKSIERILRDQNRPQ